MTPYQEIRAAAKAMQVKLTDLGFSSSMAGLGKQHPLFVRLLRIRGITMTTGMSFIFPPERIPGLVQAYRQKTKKVPPADLAQARFVFFLQKFRAFGDQMEYQDVV